MKDLVHFIKKYELDSIPLSVQETAKYVLLDTIGVMQSSRPMSKLQSNSYEYTSWSAAFISGTKLVENELDEGNSKAKGHPACHFVPALIQLAKTKRFSDEQILLAFITGYEVAARMGEIITLNPIIHPHANWGAIGGAAAFAKLYDWDENQIQQALNIAAQLASPTLWTSVFEGHEIRNPLVGFLNLNLLLLPELVYAGYNASDQTMRILFSKILGIDFNEEALNLNQQDYYLDSTYFKFYDSCRFCHSSMDGIQILLNKMDIQAVSDIQRIDIYTYKSAAQLNNQQPNNEFAGKFSIPYAVGQQILRSLGENPEREQILKLASKIFVTEDEKITAKLESHIRGTTLVVATNDVTQSYYLETATGDVSTKNLNKLIEQKFIENMKHLIDEQQLIIQTNQFLQASIFPYDFVEKGDFL